MYPGVLRYAAQHANIYTQEQLGAAGATALFDRTPAERLTWCAIVNLCQTHCWYLNACCQVRTMLIVYEGHG